LPSRLFLANFYVALIGTGIFFFLPAADNFGLSTSEVSGFEGPSSSLGTSIGIRFWFYAFYGNSSTCDDFKSGAKSRFSAVSYCSSKMRS